MIGLPPVVGLSFGQQIIPTFIGAITAFILSLALFYFAQKWINNRNNRDLNKNLQKEFDYNISFLEKFKTDFDEMLRQITANDKLIFIVFRFYRLQRLFITEAFSRGLLYQYLTADEISDLDVMLNYFDNITDENTYSSLRKFRDGEVTQQIALRAFEYHRKQIEKHIGVLKNLKGKLKKLK